MKESIIVGLLHNMAILLSFSVLYEFAWLRKDGERSIALKFIIGIILSAICAFLMFSNWSWEPGLIFDLRSVLLAISGLFFGLIPTVIMMIVAAFIRYDIGGVGVWMGIAVIISSGSIGILWRNFRPNWKLNHPYIELIGMGVLVHAIMAALTFLLPDEIRDRTLRGIAIPLVSVYIPATLIMGLLMLHHYRNWKNRGIQQKLEVVERQMRKILDSGNIVSIILNKDGSVRYCNDYLCNITGYKRKEIEGADWFNCFISDKAVKDICKLFLEGIKSKNIPRTHQTEIIAKNGDTIYLICHNTLLFKESGAVDGVASIGVNITDQKRYQKELETSAKKIEEHNIRLNLLNEELKEAKEHAEESDRLKSAFLANMSHEIRTPMNGILGFTGLLKDPEITQEQINIYVDIIERSGDRMLNIINDIIDISKIESGLMKVSYGKANINKQIEYLHTFFEEEARHKGIKLTTELNLDTENAIIETDKEKVYAVLTNLIKNAIKYSDANSIHMGYKRINGHIQFFVKDTGVGIAPERQAAIFERFIQADIENQNAIQGAGLGLAISKAYVEMLGGKMWLESKPGNGAEFYFTLPYQTEHVTVE